MNTQRNDERWLGEEIANAGVPPRGLKVPPLEKVANDDQALDNPPSIMDRDIRDAFLKMSQAITTQAQAVTTQDEAMTAQEN